MKKIIILGCAVLVLICIADDPVKDSWSIHVDNMKSICTLRNLIWPGYFAYHKANTNEFGVIIFGGY